MPEEVDAIEAIEDLINRVFSGVSTAFPATIISPSSIEGLVDVQPEYRFKAPGNDAELTPRPINNVPLLTPHRSKGTIIRVPKEQLIGSKVLCVSCEHSITEWRSSGGKAAYPADNRRFDANDCIAIMGLYPETVTWPNPQKPNTFEFLGLEGTKFQIGTNSADLVGLVYEILNQMATGGVNPDTGIFINLANITPLLAKLLTIANPVT